jgi:uncharacterized membrane protein
MPELNTDGTQTSVASLVGGLIEDTQRLIRQEVALAKRELEQEWVKARDGAAMILAAQVLFIMVAMLAAFTLVKMLQHFVLPNHEWACFAIVTAGFAVAGGLLMWGGVLKFKSFNAVPPQSVESIRQDVEAVASAVTNDRPQGSAYVSQR